MKIFYGVMIVIYLIRVSKTTNTTENAVDSMVLTALIGLLINSF